MQIENGSCTPFAMYFQKTHVNILCTFCRECHKLYICHSGMIIEKRDVNYSTIAVWVRRKITFLLKFRPYLPKQTISLQIF